MSAFKDLSGMTFGEWEVKEYLGKSMWLCKCSCGNEKPVNAHSLVKGLSKSCRHPVRDGNDVYVGAHINYWEVLESLGHGEWKCKCICGNIKTVNISSLRYGYSKSCGCKQGEAQRKSLLEKYGEVVTNKMETPRSDEQIESMNKLEQYIDKLAADKSRKPTVKELYTTLGVQKAAILKAIHKSELEEKVFINKFISNKEIEIREYIKSIYDGEIVSNNHTILKGYELDIYMPDIKVAVEFNGSYWHSENNKDKKYHQTKTKLCATKRIRLIHIFEYEWDKKESRDKIKEYLKDVINNKNVNIYYGRNTKVKQIENKDALEFCNLYHLQGGINSKVNLGIFKDNELLGVMTLSEPRFNKVYQWEIARLCFKTGVRVVGGAEKLFKYFIREYSPTSIISYANLSKFLGGTYIKMGMEMESLTDPNYVWCDNNGKVYSRYQTQKHKLVAQGIGTTDETEDSIMHRLDFYKVYDCGNIKFVWNKKE